MMIEHDLTPRRADFLGGRIRLDAKNLVMSAHHIRHSNGFYVMQRLKNANHLAPRDVQRLQARMCSCWYLPTMISWLLLGFVGQSGTVPPLPAGVDPDFQKAVYTAVDTAAKGDFERANRILDWLPSNEVRIAWDDSKVPEALRPSFARGRDEAISAWMRTPGSPKIVVAEPANLRFSFESVLQTPDGATMPRGAAHFSFDKATPRLETVIGLRRGNPIMSVSDIEVRNEVMYSLTRYMGVAEGPLFGTASTRNDLSVRGRVQLVPAEFSTSEQARRTVAVLRAAFEKNQVPAIAAPEAFVDSKKGDGGEVVQGTKVPYTFQLTNTGKGTLVYRALGDCGCVLPPPGGKLEPGGSTILRPHIDTTEFFGQLDKRVLLYTNDPEMPIRVLDLTVFIRPKFRWIGSSETLVLDAGKKTAEAYLIPPVDSKVKLGTPVLEGTTGKVTLTPWSGSIADPDMREGVKARKGYKAVVEFDENQPAGRFSGTVRVPTDDPEFPELRYMFNAQIGIVALPGNMFLGSLERETRTFRSVISRPGKAFKVTRVESGHPNLKATVSKIEKGEEWTLTLVYDGRAEAGAFDGIAVVHTDDPKQPEVIVAYRGLAL